MYFCEPAKDRISCLCHTVSCISPSTSCRFTNLWLTVLKKESNLINVISTDNGPETLFSWLQASTSSNKDSFDTLGEHCQSTTENTAWYNWQHAPHLTSRVKIQCVNFPGFGLTRGYPNKHICRENSAFLAARRLEKAPTGLGHAGSECEIIRRGLEYDYESRCQSNGEWEWRLHSLASTSRFFNHHSTAELTSLGFWLRIQAQTLHSLIC